jgi:hypothetical protein
MEMAPGERSIRKVPQADIIDSGRPIFSYSLSNSKNGTTSEIVLKTLASKKSDSNFL